MNHGERLMMVLSKGDSAIVTEFGGREAMEAMKVQAEARGMTCTSLRIEDYYPTYRGYRYFDFRNPVTQKYFNLDYLLEAWDQDKIHHQGEGVDDWFIH